MQGVGTWSLVIGLVVALASGAGHAQEPGRDQYSGLIKQALQEYEAGNWHEAKYFFAQAHALRPNARTLRGLGMVEFGLRDYVEACNMFEQSLQSQLNPLPPEMRLKVEDLLAQSRQFLARVRVDIEPAGADIKIDGQLLQPKQDGYVHLNPGTHELIANLAEHEPLTRRLDLDAGALIELKLTLRKVQPEVAALPPIQPTAQSSLLMGSRVGTETQDSAGEPGNVAPWIVIGVGGALVVTGGVLLGIAASDVATVENARRPTEWESVQSAYERSPGMSAVGFVMLGVGVVGALGGVIWKLSLSDDPDSVVLQLTPAGAHVGVKL